MDGQQIQSDSAADSPTTTGTPTPVVARAQSHKMLLVALILASLVLAVASLAVGSRSIPPGEVIAALHGAGEQDIRDIVWNLRLPRTFLAYFAGAALAVAGVLAQSWTRNPLADPGFIGVTAGASFFVALGTAIGIATSTSMRTALALVGAGITTLLVLAVSRRFEDPLTLVLVGAGVSAALGSGATIIGLYSTDVLDSMRRWTIGSTFGRGPEDVAIAGIGLVIGVACAAMVARPLDLLAMGEESSLALGGSPLPRGWARRSASWCWPAAQRQQRAPLPSSVLPFPTSCGGWWALALPPCFCPPRSWAVVPCLPLISPAASLRVTRSWRCRSSSR